MKFKLFILIIIFACSLYILAFEGGKINEIGYTAPSFSLS